MLKKIFCCVLLFMGCINCKDEGSHYVAPVFPLHYKAIPTILNREVMFSYYMQPLLSDSILIIPDVNQDTILHFYHTSSGRLIKKAVIKGKAPGELTLPTKFSMDYSRHKLYAFDYAKKVLIKYDINQILNDTVPSFEEIPLSGPLLKENEISFLRDSLYITSNGLHRLLIANAHTATDINEDYFPLITDNTRAWNLFLQTWSCNAISPAGNKYVCATSLGGIIEIYNLSPTISLSKRLLFFEPKFTQKKNQFIPLPETIYGFRNLFASECCIYATVFAKQNPNQNPNQIWQFDWEGNPIASIECPYEIGSFTVDENNHKIYAIVYNSEKEEAIASLTLNPGDTSQTSCLPL